MFPSVSVVNPFEVPVGDHFFKRIGPISFVCGKGIKYSLAATNMLAVIHTLASQVVISTRF